MCEKKSEEKEPLTQVSAAVEGLVADMKRRCTTYAPVAEAAVPEHSISDPKIGRAIKKTWIIITMIIVCPSNPKAFCGMHVCLLPSSSRPGNSILGKLERTLNDRKRQQLLTTLI